MLIFICDGVCTRRLMGDFIGDKVECMVGMELDRRGRGARGGWGGALLAEGGE